MEILYRDLGKRAEVLLGDHVERIIFCPLLLQVPQRCRRGAAEVPQRCRRGAAEVPHAEVQ